MQTYTQTFAGAQSWELNVPGRYYVTLACTNAINIRFYKNGKKLDLGDITGLLAGLEVQGVDFDRVVIDVTGADTVTIGIGNGNARYNRANATVTVSTNRLPKLNTQSQAAANVTVASTQMLAANTSRQYLFVQNNDPAAVIYLNINGAAAAAGTGIKLGPGDSYEPIAVSGAQINMIGTIATTLVTVIEGT